MACQLPRKTLPACVAALLAAGSIAAPSWRDAIALPVGDNVPTNPDTVRTITNCDDSGTGSLRDTIASAVSGDVIDLTQLACSEITLYGKIPIVVSDLTLLGPGVGPEASHHLAIYGFYDRVLEHGTGTLTISGLKIAYGDYQGMLARGGCILAQGSLVIEDSIVTGCEVDAAYGTNVFAAGGAIYAQGELWLQNTTITNNVAYSGTQQAYGGGVFASDLVTIESSTIADNKVIAPQAPAIGGGMMVVGVSDVTIVSSTISGNQAEIAGGIRIDTLGTSRIIDSTLSGNYALYAGAASVSNSPLKLINSTVARNASYGETAGIYSDQPITAQSSIVADNRSVAVDPVDISAPAVAGFANLITHSSSGTPSDTVALCPRLSALADHGGPTFTHALIEGSPGIDVGANSIPLASDQRGAAYPRVAGSGPDIGAYEWQGELDDELFKSAFEVACDEY